MLDFFFILLCLYAVQKIVSRTKNFLPHLFNLNQQHGHGLGMFAVLEGGSRAWIGGGYDSYPSCNDIN